MNDADRVWLWLIGVIVATGTVAGLIFAGFDATAEVIGTMAIFLMMLVAIGLIYTWWDRRK